MDGASGRSEGKLPVGLLLATSQKSAAEADCGLATAASLLDFQQFN